MKTAMAGPTIADREETCIHFDVAMARRVRRNDRLPRVNGMLRTSWLFPQR